MTNPLVAIVDTIKAFNRVGFLAPKAIEVDKETYDILVYEVRKRALVQTSSEDGKLLIGGVRIVEEAPEMAKKKTLGRGYY